METGEAQSSSFDRAALASAAEKATEACAADLGALLGVEVRFGLPTVEPLSHGHDDAPPFPWLHQAATAAEAPGSHVHVVVPGPDASLLARLQQGEAPAALAEAGGLAWRDEDGPGFAAVMKLVVAVLGRVLEEELGLAGLACEGAAAVVSAEADAPWMDGGPFQRLGLDLSVDGLPEVAVHVLLSEPGGEETAREPEASPLFVIDPSETERERLEGLEAELGRRVAVLDPADFAPDDIEQLAEAGAIVVAWDLRGRPGLELVETLARDARTREIPLLLSADAPTRGMVEAALRAGARSFLTRPYVADEVRRRALAMGEATERTGPSPGATRPA